MPKVSILTPVYADTPDRVVWLNDMLHSLSEQTFTDWEVIVVDDASPMLIDEVKVEHSGERYRYVRAPYNQGPARCRNTAAALAQGEAFLAVDADDELASADVLQAMVSAWEQDQTKIIYGDLQWLKKRPEDGIYLPDKIWKLAEYSFNRALDPRGLLPVTALHSKECHVRSGGWKPSLEAGLEDVEYWISAGKAGFCGQHIDLVTLLYRQHPDSRAIELRKVNRRESEMRQLIRDMHVDVYSGRYPEMCCGKGTAANVPQTGLGAAGAQASSMRVATLNEVSADQKVWVEYTGDRKASFGMDGRASGLTYRIAGTGAKFEVHVADAPMFRRSGKGRDFIVGIPSPLGIDPPAAPVPSGPPPYAPPPPDLATIERLDRQAATRGVSAQVVSPAQDLSFLGTLGVSLTAAGWTLDKIANAQPSDLTVIPGVSIGPARAARLVHQARERLTIAAQST